MRQHKPKQNHRETLPPVSTKAFKQVYLTEVLEVTVPLYLVCDTCWAGKD